MRQDKIKVRHHKAIPPEAARAVIERVRGETAEDLKLPLSDPDRRVSDAINKGLKELDSEDAREYVYIEQKRRVQRRPPVLGGHRQIARKFRSQFESRALPIAALPPAPEPTSELGAKLASLDEVDRNLILTASTKVVDMVQQEIKDEKDENDRGVEPDAEGPK